MPLATQPLSAAQMELFAPFSDEDRTWLKAMFVRLPDLGMRFAEFLQTPAALRVEKARDGLEQLQRTGWVRRGIADPETVGEHTRRFAAFMPKVLALVVRDNGMSEAQMRPMIQELCHMAELHDFGEAIIGDIPPGSAVTPDEKKRMERLAVEVIFAAPEQRNNLLLVQEYVAQQTAASHIVRDFDLLDAVFMAGRYQSKYPEKSGMFEEFYTYSEPRLKTSIGKQILACYMTSPEAVIALDQGAPSSAKAH